MFADPDWSQPIDFAERIAAIPSTSMVRGMFLQLLVDAIGPTHMAKRIQRKYSAFKNYSLREYVELQAFAVEHMRKKAPAECVRRLGWRVYPTYAKTITGTAIFAVAGYDFRRIIEVSPAAYHVGLEPAEVRVRNIQPQYALVELRNMYNIPEFHQVGIWEGAMQTCGVEGHIKTEVLDFGSVNFELRWQDSGIPRSSHRPFSRRPTSVG
jgi:uncharacterized protein (TIGR02265 family)